METVLDRMKRIDSQGAVPGTSVAEPKQPDDREQAILDRHTSATPQVSALQRAARIDAQREIDVRRQQRAYAEKAKSTDATTVDLTKEILTNLNNRSMVRGTYRQMSPAQRQEVLKLAPGIAQQLGDDRGGLAVRAINAVTGGIADVSQPIKELAGQVTGTDWGGAPEEIEFIRQLEGVSQEFAPARPDDPWYVRGPLQALQMTPWMTTVVGGNVAGSAIAKTGGQVLARGASAGVPLAKPAFQAIGAVGKAPKLLGLKGATTKGTMEGAGGLAGITAAAFPGQYAQEVDSLKELGMEDNLTMRVLAGGTAAIAGLIEGIVPNPFKAGNVPLKEGAIKAARQYLWNAAKQAPGEMSEEYLQGVTSGLGQHVAQYLDENAQEKSIADAFKTGWEQAKEAALPMAFLLGVPAVGGAANAARLARLQAIRAKGPVSRKDARELGIEAEKQEDRTAQADAEIKQLEQEVAQSTATQTVPPVSAGHAFPVTPTVPPYVAPPDGTQAKRVPWYDFGSGEPEGDIPPPPGLGLLDRLTGRSPQGTPPRLPGAPGATGATPPALPEPSGQPTRLPGSSSAAQNPELPAPTGTQPASQQPVEAESQADSPQQEVDSFAEYADAWSEQSAKRRGVEKKPLTQSMLDTLRTTIDNHADAAIQNGRSSKFATDNTAFDEREMREIQNAVRRKGYEVGEVQRSSEGGVDYIGFDVTGKRTGQPPSQASENTAPAPQQPKGGGSTTTAGQVPPITSQSPSTSGLSEGTGTKPKPGSPTVSPDAQAKPETRNGKAEGEKRSSETGPTGQPRRGEVGGKLAAGEVVTTSSGRQTTPFPKIDMGTDRKTGSTLKRVDKWLYDNAVEEARARGDDFNLRQFEAEDPAKMPPASKDAMEEYLFGEQPPVQKPITKPLVPTSATQAEQPEVQGQKPQGLTEGFRSLPAKGQAAFETEWSKGGTSIKNTLYPENKNYRAEFEARTGIKLPKGVGSTFQAVEDWHNAGRPLNPTTETAKPDRPTDWSISGQSKPIPGMESEEATYTVHSRKPDVIPDMFSVVVAGKPTGKGWTTVKGTGMSAEEAYDRAVRMFTDKRAKPQEKFSQDKQSSTPQPPEGYKPLAEFTPMVSVTKSPDLELADNIAEMKDLKLQKGDAVGYRVYPKRGSTKGGYWQYGTVEDTASSSHATIKLADGTTESVGGSRLHKLEPIGEAGLSTTVNKNSDKAPVPKQSEGDSTATAEQSEFDDAALKALDAILGVESPALETKPKATGRKAPTKAASGQFVLPGMPGMAAEIDRQDFVRKHRDQALERLWGWSDKPEDAQDIQGAIDAIAKDVGDVMNAIYSDKGIKNKDDVFASKEYQAFDAAVAAIDNDPIPGEVILNHIDNVVDKALDTRPKPRTLKKPRKSDKTLAEAKSDMQAAHDAAAKLMEKIRSKLMSGVDPELMAETVQVAYLYTKAGIKTFKGYVEAVVESFGESFAREFAPYMESGWRALHTRSVVSDPAGKVDDFLTEVSDETTQSEPGTEGNAPVGDGAGKSQGDAATTGAGTNEGRDVTEDAGQPGDSILPDGAEATQDDGRDSGAGGSTNGDTNADQSGQGQADTADDGAGSDAGSMEERLAVNHVIGADDDLAVSSITKSLDRNIKALNILKVLEKDGRFPDSAERKALAQYTGWGGLSQALDSIKGERMLSEHWMRDEAWEKKWGKAYRKLKELLSKEEFQAAQDSTENAHYTSKPIIQAIWKIAERLGYNGGRVLELGAGIGHFAGLVPSRVRGATQFTMVERDSVSSRIAKMLYPGHEIVAGDMEEFKAVPGSVTLGIGNVPFAGGTVGDSARRYNEPLNLHNYAIARHLDAVAPGGIVVAVSSHSTLDANIKQRKFLATKGELIGAIRLPNDAFAENAKTEVVTDILIFRRPRQGDGTLGVRFDQNADVKVKNKDGEEVSRAINKYFIDNPEMVLGKHSAKGSMYGPDEYTVESTPGDLQAKIDAAIEKLPRNLLGNIDVAEQVVASDATVPFGRLEIQDGKVVMGFGDKFVSIAGKKFAEFPVHLTGKTGVSRAKDYIELRDLLAGVRSTMLDETASDEAVKRSQKQLAASYDRYVKKHGPLNTSKTGIFKRDPDYYRVLALENERAEYNPETKKIEVTYEKAAIFTTRVLGPQREPDRADSPADAMSVSIAWRGAIDSEYIGKLLGVAPQEAEDKLIDEGLAFRNPATTELELADLYLSGNVRTKLSQAEISAEEDPQYKRNVEALTKVLPPPVTIKKDTVRLGATWIPEQVINAFATKEFGTDVRVTYNANTDAWTVGKAYGISETAKSKYETGRIDPDQLLSEVLNLRSIKIYDQVETGEYTASGKPKTTQTLNEKETQAAKHRASVLRAEFEKWVLGNPEVTQVLAKLYNDRYNNFVRTKYNGEFLVLPGANPEITLRPYQKDAIWRIINRGTSLLAHAVGAGKTYTMIGAAMEMRRLGLARRPLLVVQNATLGQFATSFQQMYPNANVLVADKNDLGKGKRQLFLNKISTGNWDAVVMAQSTFDNMASEAEVERAFIQDQLDMLEEAIREEGGEGARTPTVKQLVRTKKSLKARFDKLMGSRAKKEDNVTFEDLGADALFLDEAHAYKKPTFTTKLSQLVGLNVEASARSLATTIKVRSVQAAHNGRNVILATGTPVTNTLGEAWHMVNYVSPATNAEFSSRTFDQFIGNFAQVEPTLTMNAGGQYVYKDAIVKFRNGHQLVEYINDSWDIVTPDALRAYMASSKKGFPALRGGQPSAITVDRTPGVAVFMDFISQVYAKYKGLTAKERRELSFIPALAYGASKAATLDIRLVVPNAAEEKNSKLQKAAEEIKRIYDESTEVKGTQLFFSDMKNPFSMSRLRQFMGGETIDAFDEDVSTDEASTEDTAAAPVDDNESGSFLYQELRRKLLGMGIPKEQIAFISDAKTDKQRQALFERVNNGDIRVLIGSTAKMGIGVNVQKKLVALHHFDTPWLPADLEQREGRILRFGNENDTVDILRYAMKKTLDGAIYMATARKQKFIWQVLNGQLEGDSFEDPSSAAMLSIEEQLAAIQDDPVFFEKIEIQNRVREMELERQSFYDAQQRIASSLSSEKFWLNKEETSTLPQWQRRLEKVKQLQAIKGAGGLETFSMTYGNQTFDDPKKAAEFIKSKVDAISKYVIENHERSQSFDKAGGLLSLGKNQKVEFEIGPAKVVIGAEPKGAFVETDKGYTVTEFTARFKSLAYLQEPGGRHEFYEGTATTPATFFDKMQSLPEVAQKELDQSEARVSRYHAKIAELEGLLGKQWEDQAEYDSKKERLAEIEGQMLASKGNLSAPEQEADGEDTARNVAPNVVERTSVAAGTPQQSSRADFSFAEAETPQGKRLLKRMKGDSVKRKIGPRSILNFLKDIVRVASIEGKSQLSSRNPGHYKPREHLVRSRTGASGVIDTHEAGHALSALLRDVDKKILKRHEAGLVALTYMPNSMASANTAEEGVAEFVRRYIVDYQSIPESLRTGLERDIEMVAPDLLAGLKDTNRLWQQFLSRPLQERLDASKNDRAPRKAGRGFGDAVYRSLYNLIGGDVAIHKVRRSLERPLFKFSQALGRQFRDMATDTQADIDNAYQSVIRVPVETQRAIFGDTRSEQQGVSIIAFGDNMFSDEDVQYLRDGGFNVPDEFKHGERVYLTNQSFEQIREKLGDDWDAFENYGQLRASLERAERKGHQSAWMHENVSQAEARKAIADMESDNPEWLKHFDEVREFFDGLLLVATLSGEYTPSEAVRIRNAWDSYWPLLRQVTPEESSRVGRGGPDPAAGVHRAFGSALPLRNLLEAVEMRTKAAMQAYYTNRMMLAMRKYSDTLHSMKEAPFDIRKAGARLMVPLRMDLKKVATLSPEEQAQWIVDYMNKELEKEAKDTGEEVDPEDLYTVEDVAISMPWRPIFRATRPGAIQVVGLTENGQRKYYQVTDPLLFDLFSNSGSMDRYGTWLARFFAKGIGPWKRALTQNLAFAIRNAVRDPITGSSMGEGWRAFLPGIYTAYGIVGRLNGSLGKDAPARAELFSRSLEALHHPRHKKLWDSFKEAATEGILIPGYLNMNFYDRVSEAPGQLSAAALWPVTMFNWATGGRYISQMSEELQREGAFIEARGRGKSYEYAQRQYDQISGNFSQRQPNHAIATFVRSAGFLNPGLQIWWGQVKRWTDPDPKMQQFHRAKLPALAAWFSVSSAINIALVYALFGDDEEKLEEVLSDMRERPDSEQDTTMSVMGTVRLPFEYGLSGAVASFAWNSTEDALLGGSNESIPTRLRAFLARAVQVPGPTDAIHPYLKTAIELNAGEVGYSMYRQDSIVPEQLIVQYPVNPELRAYDDTPALFKQIGELARVSPLKVEYAFGALLTGTASDLIAIGDKVAGGKTLEAKDFPIISRLMQRESTGFRSQAVRELRKANQEVEAMGVKISKMGSEAPQEMIDRYGKLQEVALAYDVVSKMYDNVQDETESAETDRSAVEATEREMTRFARQFLNYQAGKAPQPKQLNDRKREYYGQKAYQATGSPESEGGIETQNKAIAALKLSGYTLQQALQAMVDHWEATNKTSAKEWKGGNEVYKDTVDKRRQALRKLYAK
jgi:N12 class adenine-specific DNA methylase/adenine-specific DNA methylase